MATRYEHYKKAEKLLAEAEGGRDANPDADPDALTKAAIHATLASVERHVAGD